MAVINSIPPQAYTRDTLVKAIEWMNTQPQALRERASSADLLVSYYLQACRKAGSQSEAPVSQEHFKQDLRHLAEDLRQFDEPTAPPTPIQPSRSPSLGQVEPLFVAPQHQPHQAHAHMPAPSHHSHSLSHSHGHGHGHPTFHAPAPQPQAPPPAHQAPRAPSPQWNVDPKSLAIAREVQNKLNLGSEAEALRLLIALGAEKAKQLFP